VGPRSQRAQGVAHCQPQREVPEVQVELAGLDLGEVKQIVEQASRFFFGGNSGMSSASGRTCCAGTGI
jgi:hypothetical protein